MTEHISCDFKWKWNSKTCQCECKNYHKCKKDYSWNLSTCIGEKVFKKVPDTSVTECDEIIIVLDIVSTKKKNTIATNNTSTPLINCHSKKVRDFYILHTVLLTIILLLIIIICYYYAKQKCAL